MQSGVKVEADVNDLFQKLKKRKECSAFLIKFNTKRDALVVDEDSVIPHECEHPYRTILKTLKPGDCRFGFADVTYKDEDARAGDKVVMFYWCGAEAKIKERMVLSSTWETVKTSFPDATPVELHDDDEKGPDMVVGKLRIKGCSELDGYPVAKNKRSGQFDFTCTDD